jgi:mannose-1-phosphate guanylyltransferase|tara:strand:+ start:83 stop:760 length:678 start_codon:yes stop_codon:yes gene_type:complete
MRVLLLSAGYGKRMRPLTLTTPKCLIKVNNKTLLEMWLEKFSQLRVKNIIINTHHLAEKINNFVKKNFREKVTLVYEPKLLGTAQTILKNYEKLKNDDCIIVHSDNYCEDDLFDLIKTFNNKPKECLITMMVFKTKFPKTCGIVEKNKNNVLINFFEKVKDPPGNLANCAVYIFSKEMIDVIKEKYSKSIDISKDIIPNLIGKINIYETKNIFYDIGTKKTLFQK